MTLSELRDRVGAVVQLGRVEYRVKTVLAEGPTVVLEATSERDIQPSAHGEARRRVPRIRDIRLDQDSDEAVALLRALAN